MGPASSFPLKERQRIMALTITPRGVDKNGSVRAVSNLYQTYTSITLDNSYTSGGIALTPAQLGLGQVFFGTINIRTAVATASPSDGVLDCSNVVAPKLKLQAAGSLAELANAAGTGAIVDVLAFGTQ